MYRLSGELGGLFLQTPPLQPSTGLGAGPAGARDSGYDSLHRRLSVLDRVSQTHAVWLQLGRSHQDTADLLESQAPGVRARLPLCNCNLCNIHKFPGVVTGETYVGDTSGRPLRLTTLTVFI